MTGKLIKKMLSVVLSVLMIVTIFPSYVRLVSADDESIVEEEPIVEVEEQILEEAGIDKEPVTQTEETNYVAQIGDTKYETLQEAVNKAAENDTIVLLADIELTGTDEITIPENKKITIDGSNSKHSISFEKKCVFNKSGLTGEINLSISNVAFIGADPSSARYPIVTGRNFSGEINLDYCTFTNIGKCAVYMDPNGTDEAKLSITNCVYNNTPLGYSVDMTRPSTDPFNVNVVFENNTGLDAGKEFEIFSGHVALVKENGKFKGQFKTLQDAFNASKAGDTIVILKDLSDIGSISLKANVTLDGKNHKVSGNSNIIINSAGSTIKDINFENIHNNLSVGSDRTKYNLNKETGKLTAVIANSLSGTATITGCTFDSVDWDAIQLSPVAGAIVNITGNTFKTTTECETIRYIHVQSEKNIDFTINVNNNKFYDGDKLNQTGLEVYYPADSDKVNLSGNFMAVPMAVCIGTGESYNNHPELANPFKDEDLVNNVYAVATIVDANGNNMLYTSLTNAIAAAKDNDVITLISDVNDATGITVDTKKTLTVDFNGHTYSVNKPGAGSNGTQTQAFQLMKDQTITFKNGTINCLEDNLTPATVGKNIKRIIQNYANLTLENMTIDGTNVYENNSVIESCNGNLNITGATSISAHEEAYALTVDTWKGYYPNGTNVVINTTGEIGNIYCYSEGTGSYTSESSLIINNGKISSVKDDGNNEVDITLNGGIYKIKPESNIAEGLGVITNTDESTKQKYPFAIGIKVAQIGENTYASLADAVAAVPEGTTTATTIIMINNEAIDVSGKAGITIGRNKNIILDLNGHTVAGICSTGKGSELIFNEGILTVKDSSDKNVDGTGEGKLTYGANPSWDYDGTVAGSYSSNLITNRNTLTIESGYYLNDATGSACYVVDNYGNGYDTYFTLNGGKLVNTHYCAVRFALYTSKTCEAVMRGGIVDSKYSCVINYQNVAAPKANIKFCGTIVNGSSTSLYESDGSANNVNDWSNFKLSVESGKFSGTDGEFVWMEAANNFVSGGYFKKEIDEKHIVPGYECIENEDEDTKEAYPYKVEKIALSSYVAAIDDTNYRTLKEAIDAATSTQTVTLLQNINITEDAIHVKDDKDIVLDLNGKTITGKFNKGQQDASGNNIYNKGVFIVHNGSKLEVKDSENNGRITVDGEYPYAAVALTDEKDYDSNKVATLTVKSGTIEGYYYGIVGNGSRHNTEINIEGGRVVGLNPSDSLGIYHPQEGKLNISGGYIKGYSSAVEIRAGELNISGGELLANSKKLVGIGNSSGSTIEGAALAISQHTTNRDVKVNISGGTFNGLYAVYEEDYQDSSVDNIDIVNISGGKFKGLISSENCTGFISGGVFSNKPDEKLIETGKVARGNTDSETKFYYPYMIKNLTVARIKDVEYETLKDAVNHAVNGDTIVMIDNETLTEGINIDKKINLDLNGFTIKPSENNYSQDYVIDVEHGGDLTIDGNGVINAGNVMCGIKMTRAGGDNSMTATLTVNSGRIIGKEFGISGNGNTGRENTLITINGGSIEASGKAVFKSIDSIGIYQPQNGNLVINGGTIIGNTGVYVKGGSVTVNNGLIKANGAKIEYSTYNNGASCVGYAFVLDNANYPAGTPSATIKGGTFISENADSVLSCGENPANEFVSGGKFNKDLVDTYVVVGKDDKLTAGWYTIVDEQSSSGDNIVDVQDTNNTSSNIVYTKTDEQIEVDDNEKEVVKNVVEAATPAVEYEDSKIVSDQKINIEKVKEEVNAEDSETLKFNIKVDVIAANVENINTNEKTAEITEIKFDVKPVVTVYAQDGSVKKVENIEQKDLIVSNENVEKKISFVLPINIEFEGDLVEVLHEGESIGFYKTQMIDGIKCVVIDADNFSEYTVVILKEAVQTVAKIDDVEYISIESATDHATDGDTIVMIFDDLTADANNILLIDAGITLDLAGQEVRAKFMTATGIVEDTCNGQGLLTVTKSFIYPRSDEKTVSGQAPMYIPVRQSVSESYKFYATNVLCQYINDRTGQFEDSTRRQAIFGASLAEDMVNKVLPINGSVKLGVRAKVDIANSFKSDGQTVTVPSSSNIGIEAIFSDSLIENYLSDATAGNGYKPYITWVGIDNISQITINGFVNSKSTAFRYDGLCGNIDLTNKISAN